MKRASFSVSVADIQTAVAWIASGAAELGASERQSFAAQVSVEELLVNALRHGGRDVLAVVMTLEALPDRLRLTLEDDGDAFDPSQAPARAFDPSLEAAQPGGWGVALVRRFAHEVSYRRADGRNIVVLDFLP